MVRERDYVVFVVEDHRNNRLLHAEVHDKGRYPGNTEKLIRSLRRHWLELRYNHPMQSIQSYNTTSPETILQRLKGTAFVGTVVFRQSNKAAVHHELLDLSKHTPARRRRRAWWLLQSLRMRYRPPAYRIEQTYCSDSESFYQRYPDLND